MLRLRKYTCPCGNECSVFCGSSSVPTLCDSCQKLPALAASLSQRFWSKVNKDGPMPTVCAARFGCCWLWTGAREANGYGSIWFDGKRRKASHASWFLAHGVWTKADLMHVCDNPPCVRPNHLIEGT